MWQFINNQLFGMKWLSDLIEYLLSLIFEPVFLESKLGHSLHFFIYDFIKINLLLCILIFVISYIQSYFPPERTRKILGKYKGIGANIIGALLGTITPFCSCSSIPIFIGFTRAGLSSGVTFSFLISSPLVDLGAFVLLTSTFGFPIAFAYIGVGLVLAVVGGTIIEKTKLGDYIEDFVKEGQFVESENITLTWKNRINYAKEQVATTWKKVFIYIVIGVAIGALIHNWIPQSIVEAVLGEKNPFSVLIATGIGVPIYADIFGTIPIAEALFVKGVGIGTILALMMSITTISLPSLIMLRQVVKPKLLFFFILIVVCGIISIGYIFNGLSFIFI